MKSRLSAALLLALFTLGASAAEAGAFRYRTFADIVHAEGGGLEHDGTCSTSTSWLVEGISAEVQQNGSPEPIPGIPAMIVALDRYQICYVGEDECGPRYELRPLSSLLGLVPAGQATVTIDKQLDFGRVEATVELFDFVTGESGTYHIQLDALGVGDTSHGHSFESAMETRGGYKLRSMGRGSLRNTDAAVSIQDAEGTELAQGQVFGSYVTSSTFSEIEISRP
jgi:hypothetical protein